MGFSAHSKQDIDRDGTIYTWGLKKPPFIGIAVGKIAANGGVLKVAIFHFRIDSRVCVLIHDCAMSENYLTFFFCPWVLPKNAIARALSGLNSFGHSFDWVSERQTWMVVMRKSDLQVVHAKNIPAFSSYHTCDSYEEEGKLKVLYCKLRGDRAGLEKNFGDMCTKRCGPTTTTNDLFEMTIDIATGDVSQSPAMPTNARGEFDDTKMIGMEFAVASPRTRSKQKPSDRSWANHRKGPARIPLTASKNSISRRNAHARWCPGSLPTRVRVHSQARRRGRGRRVSTSRLTSTTLAANLIVIDAQRFRDDPVVVIELPMHVPYTFHGAFVPK